MAILLIALGGAGGAVSRYLVSQWVFLSFGGSFPLATLLINVLGSFLMGLSAKAAGQIQVLGPLFAVGFLGAFTTFSTFSLESILLLKEGKTLLLLVNTLFHVGLSFSAVALGLWASKAT